MQRDPGHLSDKPEETQLAADRSRLWPIIFLLMLAVGLGWFAWIMYLASQGRMA